MQALPAPHRDHGGPRAGNLRPAGAQKLLQIQNLRLPGGVEDPGGALRAAGAQHEIFRGTHRRQAQRNVAPPQPGRGALQGAALFPDLRAQRAQPGQVQVDGPGAQLAPAGIAQRSLPAAGQERPQKDHGRAHLPHQCIRNLRAPQGPGIHRQRPALPVGVTAQGAQNLHSVAARIGSTLFFAP